MRGYLLDTHIWLWHVTGDPAIPEGVRNRIEEDPIQFWLSPISVWEATMLVERGRIEIIGGFREWLEETRQGFPFHEASLTTEVAILSREIDLPHRDPADRFLAATAIVYDLTLVTLDGNLKRANWLPTFSG